MFGDDDWYVEEIGEVECLVDVVCECFVMIDEFYELFLEVDGDENGLCWVG